MVQEIAFTRVKAPYGWLGNMAPYPIEYEGQTWGTSEALFQALRFAPDDPARELIRAEKSPMAAKMCSKQFADRRIIVPMSDADLKLMLDVLELKIAQHPELKDMLLATAPARIIEDCTKRPHGTGLFWGAARQPDGTWEGKNYLGKLWMFIRNGLGVDTTDGRRP